jgi:hypothetical protein
MVRIMITKERGEEFLYETTVAESVEKATVDCAKLHNLRNTAKRLAAGVRALAQFGPMRPPDLQGLAMDQIRALKKDTKDMTDADSSGMRIGTPCDARVAPTLEKVAVELEQYVSVQQAAKRVALSLDKIEELVQNVKGAVMMAYPMGLPEFDVVRQAIEGNESLAGTEASKYVLDVDTCSMWFAGKQMQRSQPLSKYLGKNDKCMIKAKLTGKGSQAPQREPTVDEETKKKMMAYWHKKQETHKKLEEEDEDSYMNSSWANPKGFKNNIHGLGGVSWRPGGGGM